MASRSQIERQISDLLTKLVGLSKYPDEDPCDDGDVIWFEKTYDESTYTYVAIRVDNGRWFTTSTSTSSKLFNNWGEMCKWMGTHVNKIYLMYRGDEPIVSVEATKREFFSELRKQINE